MIILVVIATLVAPKFLSQIGKSKTKAAKTQIELLGLALDTMRLEIGRYPTTAEGLESLRKNPGIDGWDGPYLKKDVPLDPWKNPYLYTYPSENGLDFDIMSHGADGASGGEGDNQDVANWKDLNSPG
jgi:general secretion pathway protein G